MADEMRITFSAPDGVDPLPVYEAEGGVAVIEDDEPYLLSDGITLRAPVPAVDAEGPVYIDAAGNARDAVPVVIGEA